VDWERAGRFVRAARARRYTTVEAFAEACGFSETTILDIELGRRSNFKDTTLLRVEAELGWPDGLIEALAGGAPMPLDLDPDLQMLADLWHRLTPRDKVAVLTLARQLARPGQEPGPRRR